MAPARILEDDAVPCFRLACSVRVLDFWQHRAAGNLRGAGFEKETRCHFPVRGVSGPPSARPGLSLVPSVGVDFSLAQTVQAVTSAGEGHCP